MSKIDLKLADPGSERALLATIIKNGKDAFIDISDIVATNDFTLPLNRAIFMGLSSLSEDANCETFDVESLKLKLKTLGFDDIFKKTQDLEYIELLPNASFDKGNLQLFALQIKKHSIVRDLHTRYTNATKYLESLSGDEALSDIIQKAENNVVDFISGVNTSDSLESLSSDINSYINMAIEQEIVSQVGIATGYPLFDEAIGGGLRGGTITIIGGRAKSSKSFDAMNKALNIAKKGTPVLYLDTELTKEYQRDRMICMTSGCPLFDFETRRFKNNQEHVKNIRDAARVLDDIPLYYESISGKDHTEAMAIMRRWLVKHVGFNEQGKANDCVIIYDYLKLMSGNALTKVTPEYIVLGLLLTDLHNFAVKYNVPIIGYIQLNREGIDSEETSVIAGSDRILWLCSSFTILKNKDENDVSLGCGWDYGNKKLVVVETRHGSGLEIIGDYINLHASLKPMIGRDRACGLITEGYKYSQIAGKQ